jgi:hypothetical protein
MKLKAIEVDGLYRVFNHRVPLTANDRITIVHGPNGFGKTVMLQMIASLIKGDAAVFEHVPFSEFRLMFDDNSKMVVRKAPDVRARENKGHSPLTFTRIDANGNTSTVGDMVADLPADVLNRVDSFIPGPFRRSENGWRGSEGEFYSLADILRLYPDAAQALPKKFRNRHFRTLADAIPVFFGFCAISGG